MLARVMQTLLALGVYVLYHQMLLCRCNVAMDLY